VPESLVIINTSPLLYLHQTANLDLLQRLYGTIAVPLAVQQELQVGMQQGADVPAIEQIKWIQIRPVASASLVPAVIDLGQGEAEVIALGLETTDSLLILDDQLARRIAELDKLQSPARTEPQPECIAPELGTGTPAAHSYDSTILTHCCALTDQVYALLICVTCRLR